MENYGNNNYNNQYYQNGYGQNAYGQNAYGQNAYGQNAYGQNAYGQNAYGQPMNPQPQYAANQAIRPEIPGNGKAKAGLVLGILSIVFGDLIMGIIGLCLSISARNTASADAERSLPPWF